MSSSPYVPPDRPDAPADPTTPPSYGPGPAPSYGPGADYAPGTGSDATREPTPGGETRPLPSQPQEYGRPMAPPRTSPYDVGSPDSAPYQSDGSWAPPAPSADTDYDSVRAREKEAFGGFKLGAAFFGWLTAVGATVVLVALVAGVAVGFDLRDSLEGPTSGQDRLIGIIVLVAVIFVAYYCGGYVAGRMARFNGVRQGIGVWLWSVLIAAVLAALAAFTNESNPVIQELDLSTAEFDVNDLTQESLIALGVVLGVSLFGAIVGGLAGMRFHRRVDRAGFAADRYAQE